MGAIAFLLFLAALALRVWGPAGDAARGTRVLLWTPLGFPVGLVLLFSLFTLWWPPAQPWAIAWSLSAAATMAWTAIAASSREDWED